MDKLRVLLAEAGWKLAQFMRGRNGMDTLAVWALFAGIVLWAADMFFGSMLLSLLGAAAFAYALFRCFSKDRGARGQENARFEVAEAKMRTEAQGAKRRWDARKTTKFFVCPNCGQRLSVPKGKGSLRATCPKCHTQTTVKS